MNTQSPTTLDEKLWAAEAEIKRLAKENTDLRRADTGTEWFWRIVDANGLADLPSDEEEALRLILKRGGFKQDA